MERLTTKYDHASSLASLIQLLIQPIIFSETEKLAIPIQTSGMIS